ncbi:BLUF domain-containing protein [Stenotrophomonas pavanii]|uniref:BLUF domain-containing protein n=1 Tax=Stenotrophomonas pavanii TaxID=487698 RepID=UPI00087FD924|nr:BLUF domain-containing protein [Stenotrophomonas pavanii]SDK00806.1 Sensors of blue-light using FAD [Stenotrophomonas pavanii]
MPLRAIAYASEAIPGLSMDHVDDLSRAAARFNLEAGVTGVLLYDGHRFLQYIEGPEGGINVVYRRILGARSHCELLELGRGRVSGRFFPYWSMRLLWTDPADIRSVARGNWSGLSRGGALRQLGQVVAPHLA